MTQRRHLTLVAAGGTLLATLPLTTIFSDYGWFLRAVMMVGILTGVAVGIRSLRAPVWAPTAGMIAAYTVTLSWMFPSGGEFLGLIPGPATLANFNELLVEAGSAIRSTGLPVTGIEPLEFLSTLGIGAVAIAVDLLAVVVRRPALAGVPMVAIYVVAVATNREGVSFIAFIATAAGFLWLLTTDNVDRVRRFGRRFTGDGRDVDVWEPSPLAAAGRRLGLIGLVVAILLPMAIPGMSSGLLDQFGAATGGGGLGGSGTRRGSVDLFSMLSGQLNRSDRYVMVKVTTTDPKPFYLRFGVADELVGEAGFRSSRPGNGQPLSALPVPNPPSSGVSTSKQRATVQVVDFTESLLPVYQYPTKITPPKGATWLHDRRTSTIYTNKGNARNKSFSMEYVHIDYQAEALRSARPLQQSDPNYRYVAVPSVSEVTAAVNLATKGKETQYDKVRAIHQFFSKDNGFSYSTQTRGTGGTAIVDFLSERVGFCEQYAAAMAWMVRTAGYPARVAFGFTRGNEVTGNTYTLTNFNLHAWTEVYFPDFGWVPFDATPPSSVAGQADVSWAPGSSPVDPEGGGREPGEEASTDPSAGPGATGGPGGPDGGPGQEFPTGEAPVAPPVRWPWYVLLAVLGVALLLALPAVTRSMLRRRRRIAPLPAMVSVSGDGGPVVLPDPDQLRRDAHQAWDELLDTMTDYRVPVDPAETPRATAERLVTVQRLDRPAAGGVRTIGQAEEQARYARAPQAAGDLSTSLSSVRAALHGSASRRTRLYARLLPPSVLIRWRNQATIRSSAMVNAVSGRRDAILRTVSPRRLLAGRTGR